MQLVVAATSKVAIPTIQKLKEHHNLKIITQPDRPAGRGKSLTPSEISSAYPESLKPESESQISEILKGSDLLITIAYGRLLSKEVLDIPKFGGINLHFSLLPRWRGAAPVQRALEAGDRITGVTVFQMDQGMDSGPIWCQRTVEIPYGSNATELFKDLADIGASAVQDSITQIISGGSPKEQAGEITFAPKISKSECAINWSVEAEAIMRKIRAFSESPGVFTSIRGTIIKINDAQISRNSLPPGELSQDGCVGTGKESIQLLEVTPAGKRRMSARDWLNGFKPIAGERFE